MKASDKSKIGITVTVYMRIHDAEMFGGFGSEVYAVAKTEGTLQVNSRTPGENFMEHIAEKLVRGTAEQLDVLPEDIEIISRMEYEAESDDCDEERHIKMKLDGRA